MPLSIPNEEFSYIRIVISDKSLPSSVLHSSSLPDQATTSKDAKDPTTMWKHLERAGSLFFDRIFRAVGLKTSLPDLPEEILLIVLNSITNREDLSNWKLLNRHFYSLYQQHRFTLAKNIWSRYQFDMNVAKYAETYKSLMASISTCNIFVLQTFFRIHLPEVEKATELGSLVYDEHGNHQARVAECVHEYVGARSFMSHPQMARSLREFYGYESKHIQLSRFLKEEHEFILRELSRMLNEKYKYNRRTDPTADVLSRAHEVLDWYQQEGDRKSATIMNNEIFSQLSRRYLEGAPAIRPWAERRIEYYEQDGQIDEAFRRTRRMFDIMIRIAARDNMPELHRWAERLAKYYEQKNQSNEAERVR